MNVPDRKEDADALAWAFGVRLVGHDNHPAISGRDDRARVAGDHALGVAKKSKAKNAQQKEDDRNDRPLQEVEDYTDKQRRDAEVIAFFNHALEKIPQGVERKPLARDRLDHAETQILCVSTPRRDRGAAPCARYKD